MKKLMVLSLVLAIGAVSSATLEMKATDLGSGSFLIEIIQSAPNEAGTGGIMTIDVGTAEVSEMKILPKNDYRTEGGMPTMYGWNWMAQSILVQADGDVRIQAVPNAGAGTPGIGSVVDVIQQTVYTNTASFVLTLTEQTDVGLYFSGTNAWDGSTLGQTLTLIPEPMTMGLLGLGALFLRRRK